MLVAGKRAPLKVIRPALTVVEALPEETLSEVEANRFLKPMPSDPRSEMLTVAGKILPDRVSPPAVTVVEAPPEETLSEVEA